MPTETTPAGATPAAAGATPAQTTPPPTGEPPAPNTSTQPATGADGLGEAGKRALEAERTARSAAERRANTAEDALKRMQEASLSDSEKRDKRLAELERQEANWQRERQDLLLRNAVQAQAVRLGFLDPTDAYGLLDRSAIEFEDDGAPKNLDSVLATLLKAKPHLAANGSVNAGARGTASASGRIYTTTELNDRAFYEKNRADIQAAAREGRIREA